jgi:hypothetical protein
MAIFSEISQITFIFFFILSFSFIHSKNNESIDKTSLTVVVLSQHYQSRYLSNETLNQWRLQSEREQRLNYFNVLISSEISSDLETLSIVLLLNKLSKTQRDASDWFLMLNPHTRLELHQLLDILLQFPVSNLMLLYHQSKRTGLFSIPTKSLLAHNKSTIQCHRVMFDVDQSTVGQ